MDICEDVLVDTGVPGGRRCPARVSERECPPRGTVSAASRIRPCIGGVHLLRRRRHRRAAKVPRGGTKNGCEFHEEERKKNGRCEGVFKQSRRCLGRRILRIILQVGRWKERHLKTTDTKCSAIIFYIRVNRASN